MPQVDILTFFPQVFWFIFCFFLFFLFLSYWGLDFVNLTQQSRKLYKTEQYTKNFKLIKTLNYRNHYNILLKTWPYILLKKQIKFETKKNKKLIQEWINLLNNLIYFENNLLFKQNTRQIYKLHLK